MPSKQWTLVQLYIALIRVVYAMFHWLFEMWKCNVYIAWLSQECSVRLRWRRKEEGEGSQQERQDPRGISVKTGCSEFWPWVSAARTYALDRCCWPPERSWSFWKEIGPFEFGQVCFSKQKKLLSPSWLLLLQKTWSIIPFINTLMRSIS